MFPSPERNTVTFIAKFIRKRDNTVLKNIFESTEFEDAFSVYDVRGSGRIKVGAVFPLIRSLGYNPPEAKVWVFMNELDLTGEMRYDWLVLKV